MSLTSTYIETGGLRDGIALLCSEFEFVGLQFGEIINASERFQQVAWFRSLGEASEFGNMLFGFGDAGWGGSEEGLASSFVLREVWSTG